mgnify:CR=1 FL=1
MAVKQTKADLANRLAEATRYRQSGNLKAAKAVYSDILRKDADNAEVLHLLGCLSEDMGSADQAIKWVTKAVKADPTVPAYCYNLGNMLLRQGHLAEAIRYYREAIRLKPDYAIGYEVVILILAGLVLAFALPLYLAWVYLNNFKGVLEVNAKPAAADSK